MAARSPPNSRRRSWKFQVDVYLHATCLTNSFKRKIMNKKLLCAVLLMLVAVAIVCHGAQPPSDLRLRQGKKRSFQFVIKKREYCAKARRVCSPVEDSLNDEPALADFNPE
ncbi:unnamed protein product [Porites evermanni]|uniref:Uncharacterized protein n=1 Tax=Porites evermanni TaxID=104178 RepID=A0ABN8LVE6_9CNID|nr:unnamed protein product [Porites evermanni]